MIMAKKAAETTALTLANSTEENNPLMLTKPDFLQGQEAIGTELLKKYVVPPRLKVVQPLSKAPLTDEFREGDVVALPVMAQVDSMYVEGKRQDQSHGIIFVPLFFYVEWIVTNPRELSNMPFIRERTCDPNSQIAAKSRNAATRIEPCPEDPKLTLNYIEVFNYIISIQSSSPLGRDPVLLSFSKAEHKAGAQLNALIKMRKAPIFGCQFVAHVAKRENAKGHWYGFDVSNPPKEIGPWVATQELYTAYGEAHEELKAAYEAQLLVANYDEPADDEAGGDVNEEM